MDSIDSRAASSLGTWPPGIEEQLEFPFMQETRFNAYMHDLVHYMHDGFAAARRAGFKGNYSAYVKEFFHRDEYRRVANDLHQKHYYDDPARYKF